MMKQILLTGILIVLFCDLLSQTMPKYEMRAVWMATVENIDWPSKPALPVEAQQREMIELLDLVQEYHLNTVVLQIRPAADAFYASALEPWSQWLTGEQGKAPEPYYDPLEFAIRECRKRGLDIHVWINPYRALRDTTVHVASHDHITNTHPEWFVTYGTTRYFNPGLPAVRDHVARVVSDIVKRYEVDAIHMDDYFYPYRIAGKPFPDDQSFAAYHGEFDESQRDDWRRQNTDLIIKQLSDSIRAIKPHVEFGISPFGVWRNADKDPAGSATKAGQTNYDDLFADILKWQKEGWIDYVTPQLYWHIGMQVADYAVLAEWWNNHAFECPLYIGQAFYRLDPKSQVKAWRSSKEIIRQINLNRSFDHIYGSMFFSAKYLRTNPVKLKQRLIHQAYSLPALTPANARIAQAIPEMPANAIIQEQKDTIRLSWDHDSNARDYVVYRIPRRKDLDIHNPEYIFRITCESFAEFPAGSKTTLRKYNYMVTTRSITRTESEPVLFRHN